MPAPVPSQEPATDSTSKEEIVKLRDLEGVSSVLVTHQLRDAFFVAEHTAVRNDGTLTLEKAYARKAAEAEFIMLTEGRISFEGTAPELRRAAADDPYIRAFLS